MITRRDDDGRWECIRQHDHAAISGALATAWVLGGPVGEEARFAARHHDLAWLSLDRRVELRPDGTPFTFVDHPLEARYRAYGAAIDLIEAGSAYAGWLCSRHYERFAAMAGDPLSQAYIDAETSRQTRLWPLLDAQQQAGAERDLALIQLTDALSLFVCCNPAGRTTWSWYPDGIRFGPFAVRAEWSDVERVRLDPYPLGGVVRCRYPAYRWDAAGALIDRVEHTVEFHG